MITIPEHVKTLIKNSNGAINDDWLEQYPPTARTSVGENLLTIYLNESIGVTHLEKLLDKGYKVQMSLVEHQRWENIVTGISVGNREREILGKMNLKGDIEVPPGYNLLLLPVRQKFKLLFKVHKEGDVYQNENIDIIDDLYKGKSILFDHYELGKQWKTTMQEMVKCLKLMVKEKLINSESIAKFLTPEINNHFLENVFYPHSGLRAAHQSNTQQKMQQFAASNVNLSSFGGNSALASGNAGAPGTGGPILSLEQECANFLKNMHTALENEYLTAVLKKKTDEPAVKKVRNKI